MDLTRKSCVPCRDGDPPLSREQALELSKEVPGWTLHQDSHQDPQPGSEEPRLERDYRFGDFDGAMAFVERVAEMARTEDHHPDIHIHYNRVRLVLWTHAIHGLSQNDFIVAAKISALDVPHPV